MPVLLQTTSLLILSNVFMTIAWYAHLKELSTKPWYVAALLSWGVALLEYAFQVPANRIGHAVYSVGQLKILQEVITLAVFVPFSALYLKEPLKWNYLWAGLCMCGAVYFIFANATPTKPANKGDMASSVPEQQPQSIRYDHHNQ
jgi:uncharacterized protein (DUF486 family)